MKNLLIVTTIAVSALTTGTAASDLDLINAFAISENLSMENCISIAEQAIAKTGLQVSANPEGGSSEEVLIVVMSLPRFGVCR